MKAIHLPTIDNRYWLGILLASIFGTNLGDLYAHEAKLGIWLGTTLLAVLAGIGFALERRDKRVHEFWYWLVILIIRTGATNIADFLAFRVRIPAIILAMGLALLLATLAWKNDRQSTTGQSAGALPDAKGVYWAAMLTAGVFGTVLGDDLSHLIGQAAASVSLGCAFLCVLFIKRGLGKSILFYWAIVGLARTTGTCMGDWLAENHVLDLGLPLATMISGTAFVVSLTLWRPVLIRRAASAT